MRQFEAFANPNVAQRPAFPYVVVMQSAQLDFLPTRLVMPLQRLSGRPEWARRAAWWWRSTVEGEPLYPGRSCAPRVPARLLRQPACARWPTSSRACSVDALDAVISGI